MAASVPTVSAPLSGHLPVQALGPLLPAEGAPACSDTSPITPCKVQARLQAAEKALEFPITLGIVPSSAGFSPRLNRVWPFDKHKHLCPPFVSSSISKSTL